MHDRDDPMSDLAIEALAGAIPSISAGPARYIDVVREACRTFPATPCRDYERVLNDLIDAGEVVVLINGSMRGGRFVAWQNHDDAVRLGQTIEVPR